MAQPMWFVFQGLIIFGVFCWIGQYVDYIAEPEFKKPAGIAGFIAAYGVTVALVYLREWMGRLWRGRVKRRATRTLSLVAPNVAPSGFLA
jgi:hypothetical protein